MSRLRFVLIACFCVFGFTLNFAQEYQFNQLNKYHSLIYEDGRTVIHYTLSNTNDNSYYGLLTQAEDGFYELFINDYENKKYARKLIKLEELSGEFTSHNISKSAFTTYRIRERYAYYPTTRGVFDTLINDKPYKALAVSQKVGKRPRLHTFVIDQNYSPELPILSAELFQNSTDLRANMPQGRIVASSVASYAKQMIVRRDFLDAVAINLKVTVY